MPRPQSTHALARRRREELRRRLEAGADRVALAHECAEEWGLSLDHVRRWIRRVAGKARSVAGPRERAERLAVAEQRLAEGRCTIDIVRELSALWGIGGCMVRKYLDIALARINARRRAEGRLGLPRPTAQGRDRHAVREGRIAAVTQWLRDGATIAEAGERGVREFGVTRQRAREYARVAYRRDEHWRRAYVRQLMRDSARRTREQTADVRMLAGLPRRAPAVPRGEAPAVEDCGPIDGASAEAAFAEARRALDEMSATGGG